MKKLMITFSISLLLLLFNSNSIQAQCRIHYRPVRMVRVLRPVIRGPQLVWIPGFWRWDNFFGRYFWVHGRWAGRESVWIGY